MRIVYAGTPEFAVASLAALLAAGHSIAAVYTQPDRQAGRGRGLSPSPVKVLAASHGLPVLQPDTLKGPQAVATLAALAPEAMVVAAYGLLVPPAILAVPRLGCLNVHASLLPRWRGAAPIQRAIEAGDAETGVCLMHMEAGLDTGPVYARRSTPIMPSDTAATLGARLAALGAGLLVEGLGALAAGEARATAQPQEGVTYAHKLVKSEALIDWQASAPLLERRIRAFDPWPMAHTLWRATPLRVVAARLGAGPANAAPGTLVARSALALEVATGDGVLALTRVQLPGRNAMNIKDFMNGTGADLTVGTVLGT